MNAPQDFRATKLYDILAASPLIFLYGLGIAVRQVPDVAAELHALPSSTALAHLGRDVANIAYFSLLIALVFLRRMPVAKSIGVFPRALALASAYMSIGRGLLPFAHLPLWLDIVAACLTALGTLLSIFVLFELGQSFSILPEARRLVTSGPYRIVRHPLYVSEELGNIGVMLQYIQPWSLLIQIVNIALQLWRITLEERVLARTFPEYASYAAHTRRIIPGVY